MTSKVVSKVGFYVHSCLGKLAYGLRKLRLSPGDNGILGSQAFRLVKLCHNANVTCS